ncbi:MAG: amino acid adenylation domain-containing protein, partial [Polyangiaceae bacterium]
SETRLLLSPESSRGIREQARRAQVSAAALFHLAWALVLAKTTGKSDVVFGTVLFGRAQGAVGEERAFGLFMNTLPVRVRLRSGVADDLRATQGALAQLIGHEYASLSLAQRCSGIAPGMPLFSTLLNYRHNGPQFEAERRGSGMAVLGSEEYTNYPLCVSIDDLGEGFRLCVQVSAPLDASQITGYLQESLEQVVRALAHAPNRPTRDLSLLGEAERQQLRHWGSNHQRYPSHDSVSLRFEACVRAEPNAVALLFEELSLTYDELNRRSNRLAHRLLAEGVTAEVKIGIAVERSIDMVVSLLAILKARGVYVPLDPGYPAERLQYMIQDSGLTLLLTHAGFDVRQVEASGLVRLAVDQLDLSAQSEANPRVEVHPGNLAYVIYTSGSTGRPKGIGITHGTFAEHCQIGVEFFGLTRADRMLQFSTINFDASVEQLFCPLIAGAAVVLRGPEVWDPQTFYRELMDKRISVTDLPTAYWQLLSQEFAREPKPDFGVWRQAQAMGEAMPPEGLRFWRDAGLAHVKLLNTYGPTETVVTATLHDCTPYVDGRAELPRVMPIGGPLAGRHLYVLDADLSLLPAGVPGELFIGGELLARGYERRAGLTAERFVADPFAGAGGRLYRTGDLVRFRGDGALEYLGRVDNQVKIRGFRIELGEIEAQLLALPRVREAVVVAKPGVSGGRLIAYLAMVNAARPIDRDRDVATLRAALTGTLPEYMVPSAFVILDSLPLTPNGKIDRKALPDSELSDATSYEPPSGGTEVALAGIWSELLGTPRIGRHDHFFELGGHSLLAMQMVARVQTALGKALAVRDVFLEPRLSAIASLIEGAAGADVVAQSLSEIDSFMDGLETVR